MNQKPPWGMVFSVAAMIVAISVLGYAVKRAVEMRGGGGFGAQAPALEIRWSFVSGDTTVGSARNLSDAPVSITKMFIAADRDNFKNGFYRGTDRVAALANWEREVDRQDHEAIVKMLSGRMNDTVIPPGGRQSFRIPIAMRQLPSGLVIESEDGSRIDYSEQLPR